MTCDCQSNCVHTTCQHSCTITRSEPCDCELKTVYQTHGSSIVRYRDKNDCPEPEINEISCEIEKLITNDLRKTILDCINELEPEPECSVRSRDTFADNSKKGNPVICDLPATEPKALIPRDKFKSSSSLAVICDLPATEPKALIPRDKFKSSSSLAVICDLPATEPKAVIPRDKFKSSSSLEVICDVPIVKPKTLIPRNKFKSSSSLAVICDLPTKPVISKRNRDGITTGKKITLCECVIEEDAKPVRSRDKFKSSSSIQVVCNLPEPPTKPIIPRTHFKDKSNIEVCECIPIEPIQKCTKGKSVVCTDKHTLIGKHSCLKKEPCYGTCMPVQDCPSGQQFKCLELLHGKVITCITKAGNDFEEGDIVMDRKTSVLYEWNGAAFETPISSPVSYPVYILDPTSDIIWCGTEPCKETKTIKYVCGMIYGDKVLDCLTHKFYILQKDCTWKEVCKIKTLDANTTTLYNKVKDAVVSIVVKDKNNNWYNGTGFFVCRSGKLYIVTAGHLAVDFNNFDIPTQKYCEFEEYWCTVSNVNGTMTNFVYELEYVGVDGAGDIGVLKTKDVQPVSTNGDLVETPTLTTAHKCLEWGNSRQACPGTSVCAVGDPLGLDAQSITCGVVRDNKYAEGNIVIETVFHDVSLYDGNSGSPIMTDDCKVIGIHSFGMDLDEMNGAIAQYIAEPVVNALIDYDLAGRPQCPNNNHSHVDDCGRYVKGYLDIITTPVRALDIVMRGQGNYEPCGVLLEDDSDITEVIGANDILLRSWDPKSCCWINHGNLMGQCPFTSLTWFMSPCDILKIQFKDYSDNDTIKTACVKLGKYNLQDDRPLTDMASHMM